jgi:hypothetical protein
MAETIRPTQPNTKNVKEEADLDDPVRDRDDVSPHHGGRAQPGDVLGLETGGETTEIGDTEEDENERRRKAEKNAR